MAKVQGHWFPVCSPSEKRPSSIHPSIHPSRWAQDPSVSCLVSGQSRACSGAPQRFLPHPCCPSHPPSPGSSCHLSSPFLLCFLLKKRKIFFLVQRSIYFHCETFSEREAKCKKLVLHLTSWCLFSRTHITYEHGHDNMTCSADNRVSLYMIIDYS